MGNFNYDHLQNPQGVNKQTQFLLSVKDVNLSTGRRSDSVKDGRYGAVIANCTPEPNKKGNGVNFHFEFELVEPAEFKGLKLHKWVPAPVTSGPDGKPSAGESFMSSIAASALSSSGKLDEFRTRESFPMNAESFIGKRVHLKVATQTEGEYAGNSEIAAFISVEEFKQSPGPIAQVTHEATPRKELLGTPAATTTAPASNGTTAPAPTAAPPQASLGW